ncbi:recombinase family protein [Donghicola sp. XS_ASV15]|uniref:recombinase family protein n=1 Tax=Donghicola sp. XS_ASV15 TaxID=3241295 RepID=UPI0035112869
MLFNILATFAEFEGDLIRMRTREGMAIARAWGKLRDKQSKLSDCQSRDLRRMYDRGECSVSDLAEVFSVPRPIIHLNCKYPCKKMLNYFIFQFETRNKRE